VPRVLPAGLCARLRAGSWDVPPVFAFLQEQGRIDPQEMYHVFNMGLGLVLFVDAARADAAVALLRQAGEDARRVGDVVAGERSVVLV